MGSIDLAVGGPRAAARGRTLLASTAVLAIVGVAAFRAEAQSFNELPSPSGRPSTALAVSADGTTVVGEHLFFFPQSAALRWNADGEASLYPGDDSAPPFRAHDVSADGSVAVGEGLFGIVSYRWDDLGNYVLLQGFGGGELISAQAISADGSVAVGYAGEFSVVRAVKWDAEGLVSRLAYLDGSGSDDSFANDVSADGSIIVGTSEIGDVKHAVRWTGGGAAVARLGIPTSDGGVIGGVEISESEALGISSDGNVVVGIGRDVLPYAMRWVGDQTGEILSSLQTEAVSQGDWAIAANRDGSVIVGESAGQAVRWTDGEVQSLQAALVEAGVDMAGWTLSRAEGVSDDGRTIVGWGLSPESATSLDTRAWIMRAGALVTPEDSARSLASLGAAGTSAQAFAGGLLGASQEYALQHAVADAPEPAELLGYASAAEPGFPVYGAAAPDPRRWRVFATAEGHGRGDPEGGHGLGQLGASYAFAPHAIVGAAIGVGAATTDMAFGGRTDLRGLSATVFAAHAPATGLQAVASATGIGFAADIRRGYANGGGTATSEGETDGYGLGAALRLGYAIAATPQLTLTPFGAIEATHISLDGYTEANGPLPAAIGRIEDTATVARLGLEARHNLSATTWLYGSVAWAHRFEDEAASVDAELIGLFGVSGNTMAVDRDWGEFTAGISHGFGDGRSRMTASATILVPGEDVSVTGRLGISMAY